MSGRDTLRAGIETSRQRNGYSEAPFKFRIIHPRLVALREIDGFGENSLSLCCSDKLGVVSHWICSSSLQPRNLFLKDFDCDSVELGVFQQRCKPAFHRECTTKRNIPVSDGEAILDVFAGVAFESLIYSVNYVPKPLECIRLTSGQCSRR